MKKLRTAILLMLITTILLVGCSGNVNTENSVETNEHKNILNFGITGDPVSLDPVMTTDQMSWAVYYQLYDTIVVLKDDGSITPGLAENWDFSKDGKELTLYLRKDVKFHNGDLMTAEDVAFSIDRISKSKHTAQMLISYKSVEIIDDYTVKINYDNAYGAALECLSQANAVIVSKRAVEEDEEGFAKHPIGTGPYKFVERKSGEKIVLKRFDDYFMGKAAIEDLVFKIMTDSNTAVVALEKGELDLLSHAPLTDRANLIANDNIQWHETEIAGLIYVIFNNEHGTFSNKKLRQAISYGIDKEIMVLGAVEGYGTPLKSMMPKAVFGYLEEFEDTPYDLDKAKELLVEAGYPNGLSVKIKTQENPTYYKPVEVLQGQLANMGIQAEIVKMERGAFFDDVLNKFDFDISIMNWTAPVPDADYLYEIFHSSAIENGLNFVEVNIPRLDELLDKGRTELDSDLRLKIYKEACEILRDEAVVIPLYSFMAPVAANKNLKGVKADSIYRFHVFEYSW